MKSYFNKCVQTSTTLLLTAILASAGLTGCGGGGGSDQGTAYSTNGNVVSQTTVTSSSWVAPVAAAAR